MIRVSSVTSAYESFGGIPEDVMDAAIIRGNLVHAFLHDFLMGKRVSVPEGVEGYCEAGAGWIERNVAEVISAEKLYEDPFIGFYGHPDAVVELTSGKIWIPDYKTGATESKSWPLKIAAYHHLVCREHGFNREEVEFGALMLGKNGKAKFKHYGEAGQGSAYFFGLFLKALDLKLYFEGGNYP